MAEGPPTRAATRRRGRQAGEASFDPPVLNLPWRVAEPSLPWLAQLEGPRSGDLPDINVWLALAVQEHKGTSDLMLIAAWIAAAAAGAVFFTNLIPGVSLLARLAAIVACLFLLWTMQASLHTGSELTHTHFFGPNAPKPPPGTEDVIRLKVQ